MITSKVIINRIKFTVAAVAVAAAALFLLGLDTNPEITGKCYEKQFDYAGGKIILSDFSLKLEGDGSILWQTDNDVYVKDAISEDIDGDGLEELLLLTLKKGSYGKHKPFWVKENDSEIKNHIFIYRWDKKENRVRALWMSSALRFNIDRLGAGKKGKIFITQADGTVSSWYWNNFGLKLWGEKLNTISCAAVGDLLLHKTVIAKGMREDDYTYLFNKLPREVSEAEFKSLNQETPLVTDKSLVSDYPRFATHNLVAKSVAEYGFNLVSCANNHALDQGIKGINCTIDSYDEYKVLHPGIHRKNEDATEAEKAITFFEQNGIKIAALSFTYGSNGIGNPKDQTYALERFEDESRLIKAMDYARENADCVIMYAHWGDEYSREISEEQKRLSNLFLEHGVDVVIGTHPHVCQTMEYLTREDGQRMLVYYSLGNMISSQQDEECKIGGAATFKIVKLPGKGIDIIDANLYEFDSSYP